MIIFVPANNKGGVGKTAKSSLFAEYASKILKKNTLAIDFDPQCNFSHRYLDMEVDPASPEGYMPPIHPDYDSEDLDNSDWDGRSSIADIFYGEGVLPYPTFIEKLDVAPAYGDRLLAAEAVRRSEVVDKVHNRLREFLNSTDVQEAYDIVVIDTAPSKGPLTVSAIRSATHLVIPTIMEDKPIQGVYGMLQLWMQESLLRDKSNPLKLIGILANMYDRRTTLHREMYQSLQENEAIGKYVIPHKLGKRVAFAEVDCVGATPKSIFDLPEKSPARQEAVQVCEYIAEQLFN